MLAELVRVHQRERREDDDKLAQLHAHVEIEKRHTSAFGMPIVDSQLARH